ncbi:hypothetical protein PHISCL_00511 [Aspergillus sclerotialis]|uniref:RRM domain-containing protein n=1 Tax=Aspergillus sclerotialis TaxID=2070753 RepID=A0A3A2ZVI8_9EURO|nr:hypothetical protein PHISCL_00511 [Aspergillus sclerotialis]
MDESSCPNEPNNILDSPVKTLSIPVLEPIKPSTEQIYKEDPGANVLQEGYTPTVKLPDLASLLDGKASWINWIIKGPTIFDNQDEELDVVSCRPAFDKDAKSSDLWFFQYGLRYIPGDDEHSDFRTVTIKNITVHSTLRRILPTIRGDIYSVRLMDTRPITGYYTAIIVFVWQSDATKFLCSAPNSRLRVGSEEVKLSLVNTPTYPIPAELADCIYNKGYTRFLGLSKVPDAMMDLLYQKIERLALYGDIDCMERHGDGVYFSFNSIKAAAALCDILKHEYGLNHCKITFRKTSVVSSD